MQKFYLMLSFLSCFPNIMEAHSIGGNIAENLWHHLRRMGLSDSDEIHPVLGNIKQALEALVQQRLELSDRVEFLFMVMIIYGALK